MLGHVCFADENPSILSICTEITSCQWFKERLTDAEKEKSCIYRHSNGFLIYFEDYHHVQSFFCLFGYFLLLLLFFFKQGKIWNLQRQYLGKTN
jgi:hypothetical protein